MSRELDVQIAKALGCDVRGEETEWPQCGCAGNPLAPHGDPLSHSGRQLPRYSKDIEHAWELDGEGWEWQFDETRKRFLDVIVWTEHGWFDAEVRLADVQSKAEAYARGRCLVWLKAKEDDDDRE